MSSTKKYQIKANVFIQGTLYRSGNAVELTDEIAKKVIDYIEPIVVEEKTAVPPAATAAKAANAPKVNK